MLHKVHASKYGSNKNLLMGKYNTAAMCPIMFEDLGTIGDKACGKEYDTHTVRPPRPRILLDYA